jgi:hypothetical protein
MEGDRPSWISDLVFGSSIDSDSDHDDASSVGSATLWYQNATNERLEQHALNPDVLPEMNTMWGQDQRGNPQLWSRVSTIYYWYLSKLEFSG